MGDVVLLGKKQGSKLYTTKLIINVLPEQIPEFKDYWQGLRREKREAVKVTVEERPEKYGIPQYCIEVAGNPKEVSKVMESLGRRARFKI